MSRSTTVAVVRSDNRRGAVAQALALIADDLRAQVAADVLIKPHLISPHRQQMATHADTLSATLDALLAAGVQRVIVAEGASEASLGFDRFGFRKEVAGRPVAFLDLHRQETAWERVPLRSVDDQAVQARISRTVADSPCRVSLAVAKTDASSTLALSLANMVSSIHPEDLPLIHGQAWEGSRASGWKRWLEDFLQGDSRTATAMTRMLGRVCNLQHALRGRRRGDAWRRFSRSEIAQLRSVEVMSRNLVSLARAVKPHVSVVDGFLAMHREGPRHGSLIRLGTVIAGTDFVAVDAVAAAVMGFDPMKVGHLRLAHEAGLGRADLDAIQVVGDPIASVRRRCVPHSHQAIHGHWDRLPELTETALPAPHVSITRAPEHASR